MHDRACHELSPKRIGRRVEILLDGPWPRDIYLLRDVAGRVLLRIGETVYARKSWIALPLSGIESEELRRVIPAADRRLAERMAAQRARDTNGWRRAGFDAAWRSDVGSINSLRMCPQEVAEQVPAEVAPDLASAAPQQRSAWPCHPCSMSRISNSPSNAMEPSGKIARSSE